MRRKAFASQRHANEFFSPAVVGWRKVYTYERRPDKPYGDDERMMRTRDRESKGTLKVVDALVARDAVRRGVVVARKGSPGIFACRGDRERREVAERMESHFAHLPSHKADTTVLSSKIHCPAARRNAGEMSPRARKINDQISRRFRGRRRLRRRASS